MIFKTFFSIRKKLFLGYLGAYKKAKTCSGLKALAKEFINSILEKTQEKIQQATSLLLLLGIAKMSFKSLEYGTNTFFLYEQF